MNGSVSPPLLDSNALDYRVDGSDLPSQVPPLAGQSLQLSLGPSGLPHYLLQVTKNLQIFYAWPLLLFRRGLLPYYAKFLWRHVQNKYQISPNCNIVQYNKKKKSLWWQCDKLVINGNIILINIQNLLASMHLCRIINSKELITVTLEIPIEIANSITTSSLALSS